MKINSFKSVTGAFIRKLTGKQYRISPTPTKQQHFQDIMPQAPLYKGKMRDLSMRKKRRYV